MVFDGHIHVFEGQVVPGNLSAQLTSAGVSGGILISLPPPSFFPDSKPVTNEERLDNLFAWAAAGTDLYPFYWIDPTEADALTQVDRAVRRGVKGFKVICDRFYASDERAMKTFRAAAERNKPLLFHSGILWDGKPSSKYNRPAEFEILMEIPNLKFSLAHVSWPWCDEAIAVYGKFQDAHAHRPDLSAEMFIDLTPGTPAIYRREVLTKLFTVGYNVADNVIFGLDTEAGDYDPAALRQCVSRDNEIYQSIGLDPGILCRIYEKNLKRFVGAADPPAGT